MEGSDGGELMKRLLATPISAGDKSTDARAAIVMGRRQPQSVCTAEVGAILCHTIVLARVHSGGKVCPTALSKCISLLSKSLTKPNYAHAFFLSHPPNSLYTRLYV
jgi:hypothetical protein